MTVPMYAPAPSGGGSFTPPPAGTHGAICYRLIDLGTQQVEYQGETKRQHKIVLSWEISELMDDGQPYSIHQRYTLSMHEKATLRRHLESWRGLAFSDADATKFDIASILGKPCLLGIVHATKGDNTYANIASVSKLPKGMTAPTPHNSLLYFNLAAPDWSIYEKLSEGLRAIIARAPEYAEALKTGSTVETGASEADSDLDDSIPF